MLRLCRAATARTVVVGRRALRASVLRDVRRRLPVTKNSASSQVQRSFATQAPASNSDSGNDFRQFVFHYSVSHDGDETEGPVTFQELSNLYANGTIDNDTLVWHADMGSTWSSVAEVKGLKYALEHGDEGAAAVVASQKPGESKGLDDYKDWADATTSGPRFWLNEAKQAFRRGKEEEKEENRVEITDEQLDAEIWYYAPTGKEQLGPVSIRKLQQLYMFGDIDRRVSLWKEGMDVWYQLVDLEEVRIPVMRYDAEFGCKWKEFKDLDGKPYYNSLEGKESEWQEPEVLRQWRVANGVPTAAERAAEARALKRKTPERFQRYRDSIWSRQTGGKLLMSRDEYVSGVSSNTSSEDKPKPPVDPDEPMDLAKPFVDFFRNSIPYRKAVEYFAKLEYAALQHGFGYFEESSSNRTMLPPDALAPGESNLGDPKDTRGYYFNTLSKQAFWVHPYRGPVAERAGNLDRLKAAAIDTIACTGAGVLVWAGMDLELEADVAAKFGGFITFLVGMVMRDSIFEGGTRSVGKRIAGLEIVRTDPLYAGMLAGRVRTAMRNSYLPLTQLGQIIFPWPQIAFTADFASIFLNPTRRRLGDYLAKTAVVYELPERAARVADFKAQLAQRDIDENLGRQHDERKTETFGPLQILSREEIEAIVRQDHRNDLGSWRRGRIDEETEDSERYFSVQAGGYVGTDAHDDQFHYGQWIGDGNQPGSFAHFLRSTYDSYQTPART